MPTCFFISLPRGNFVSKKVLSILYNYKKLMPALDSSLCPPDIRSRYTFFVLTVYSQITPFIVLCRLEFLWGKFLVYQVCLQHHRVWDQLTFIISTGWFLFGDIDEAVCRMTYNSFNYLTSSCQDQPRKGSRKRRARKVANLFSHVKEKTTELMHLSFFLLEVSVHIRVG